MRKILLSLLFVASATMAAFAAKEDSYVLHEGFEEGAIPATWTQECVTGQQAWAVETSAEMTYPTGAYLGGYAATLRNTSAQTQRYVSRLITPVIDLSETFQPILVFSHAQPQRTGDVDTLRIYYRTSADSRWVKLAEYNQKISTWQTDTIDLVAYASATAYQICFEGADNFGRGISLDEVIVRPMPTCDDPSGVTIDGLTANSATLRWIGSLDTDSFHVVLATENLEESSNPNAVVLDTFTMDFNCSFEKLTRNKKYYVYIQAHCGLEWSEIVSTSFTTKNLASVPYTQTFNLNYASGTVNHVAYWSYGTSIKKDDGSMEYMPFVNQSTTESSWKNYSYSQTTCLAFTGARNLTTAIPAGEYVYAATPEMNVNRIQDVMVNFWGTAYDRFGENYKSALIVGIMTDPADYSTFVPVDTVFVKADKEYARYSVYFNNYTGTGKYIAFASDFLDKDNIFFLDEVEVKMAGNVGIATDVEVSNVRAQSLTVDANVHGAQQVKIVVARDTIDAVSGAIHMTPAGLPASYILSEQTINANQLPYTVTGLTGGQLVQVYVTTMDGAKEVGYALPVKALLPMHWDGVNDMTIDFEDDGNNWYISQLKNFSSAITATYYYPFSMQYELEREPSLSSYSYCYIPRYGVATFSSYNYGHNAKACIILKSERREFGDGEVWTYRNGGQGISLPEVDTIQNLVLKFYLKCYSTTNTDCSRVRVGVVEDPCDFSTFVEVARFDGSADYRSCVASFANYTGNGHYPVILSAPSDVETSGGSGSGSGRSYKDYTTSYNIIDDITLMGPSGCLPPAAVTVDTQDTVATLSWGSNGQTEWLVTFYDKNGVRLDSANVNTTSYVFHNLLPHTAYKYSVVTVCDGVATDGDINEFKTDCSPAETVPYFEGFEGYAKYGSTLEAESPACWYFPRYKYTYSGGGESSTSYYPYVTTGTTYAHSGNAGIYWYYNSTTTLTTDAIIALPRMNADLNALQLSFWIKANTASYASDTVYVGAMTDPTDLSTFDTVAAVRVGSTDYKERIVRFENYTGRGEYIAIRRPRALAAHFIYLDDFRVDSLSNCEKVMDVTAKNMSEQGASFTWTSQSSSQWEVVLANAETTLGSSVEVGDAVLGVYTTTTKPFVISDCPQPNTQYYVYVRALCGEGNKGEWSQPCTFKTTCVPVTAGVYGTETFSTADAIDCWTVGVREGSTAKPSRNTNGYLYMFNTTASDGAYAIMPMLDVDSITRLQVSFDAHGGTTATYLRELTVGVITNPSDLSTFSALKTVSLKQVSATTAAVGYGFNEGLRYTVRFDEYEGDYNGDFGKQIMFLSESGELANYIYVDNITIDTIPACLEPLEISLVEANANDLTITWDSLGGEYEVKLTKGATVVKDTVVSTTTLMIDGLEMLVKYDAQVRHICGAGDTSVWSNVRSFSTACPAVYPLPYSESFEDYTILTSAPYSQPNCWNAWYGGAVANTSSASYCRMYATAKYQGTAGYYMGSTTGNATTAPKEAIAVLPAIDQLSSAQITFFAKGSTTTGTRGIAVGISEYADDLDSILANVVWIDSVTTIDGTWAPYTFNLTSYTGEGKHIVLRCFGGNTSATTLSTTALYTYLDDIYVEKVPSCFRPYGLAVASATATSMTLSWTPQGNETAWDIACVAKGGELTDATITTVNAIPGTVNGLTASSEYDFYVRANCGEGDVSAWSDLTSATTLCIVNAEDASWSFDDPNTQYQSPLTTTATYKLENCWIVGNTSSTSYMYIPYCNKNATSTTNNNGVPYVSSKYAYSDSCALKFGNSTATANGSYAIMPEVIANLDTMQVRFKGRAVYESYSTAAATVGQFTKYYNTYATGTYARTVRVGVVSDPYDMSTFEELGSYQFQEVTNANCSTKVDGDYWEEVVIPLYGATGKYVCFWAEAATSNYFWIDDVVLEKESGCALPGKLEVTNVEATSASFAWGSSKSQWNVKVEMGDSVVAQAVVDSLGWTVDNLESHTNYTFSVQAICSAEETSDWASLSFSTPCAPFDTASFATDFQDVEPYFGNTTYNLPGCWDGGQLTKASATTYTYMPQAFANTTTYQYSRGLGTTDRALRFYHATTYGDSYVILPNMDFELDSVALHFWMRAAYFYTPTYSTATNRNKLASANNNYEKNLVIGAIADPTDMTTFVALDTVTYSQSWSSTTNVFTTGDASGNDYWEEVTLPLKKYAGKGQLVLFYPFNAKASYMFVDDLSIVGADFCTAASGLRVSNISAHSATLNWMVAGKDSVQLQVAKNSDEFKASDIILDQVLANANGTYNATNLLAGQDYYFRIKHFCSADEEADWTTSGLFVTDYEVRFVEQFADVRTYPVDWTRHSVKVADIFGGAEMSAPVTETAVNWTRSPNDGDMYVSTGTGTGTGVSTSITNYNYWLITPTIDLTQQSATDSLMLSFNLRLTNNNNQLPFNTPAVDDQFIVAVSEDGGVTFTRENATVWSFDTDADRSYASITGEPSLVFLDMTKHIGHDVKIAFVQNSLTTSGKPSSKNYLHIDNVSLNRYTASEYDAQICQWNDYADANFFVDANDLVVGATTDYVKYVAAAQCDQVTTMHLTVASDTVVRMEATVCEGEDYLLDGFQIVDAQSTYTYKQKLTGVNTCDSIVELKLNVLPRLRTRVEQTICQGDYYEFNGVRYYTNTIHTDTLVSAATGCDSIVTLYLTVNEILRGEEVVYLCPGDSYTFGKFGAITENGTYVDTIKNALGCDSVATVVVERHDVENSTLRAAICQGETYTYNVWSGLKQAGDYPSKRLSIYGCDSIVTLHLMVAGADLKLVDSIAVTDLPYVLNGEELLDATTTEGVYTKQVQLSCGTAALTIVVGNPSALHSVLANSLAVMPNPASVGEQIFVSGNFPIGSAVRVYSATGQLVYSAPTTAEQIVLPGLPATGAYMVTLTSEGKIYQSKLVVK